MGSGDEPGAPLRNSWEALKKKPNLSAHSGTHQNFLHCLGALSELPSGRILSSSPTSPGPETLQTPP